MTIFFLHKMHDIKLQNTNKPNNTEIKSVKLKCFWFFHAINIENQLNKNYDDDD